MRYQEIKKELEDIRKQLNTGQMLEQSAQELAKRCEEILDEMISKIDICQEIKYLRRRMRCTNFFFHLVRNNPRHREQYYFALIAIVGYEKWGNINEDIRMNWESARLSFDRMYGMLKDFSLHTHEYVTALETEEAVSKNISFDITEMYSVVKSIEEKDKEIFKDVKGILKKIDSILPPWSNI